jgi:hypothetical protein
MAKFKVTTKEPHGSARQSIDFPDEAAASEDAQRALLDMAHETLPNGARADFAVKIEDKAGDEVYSASLAFRSQGRQDQPVPKRRNRQRNGG